MCTAAQDKSFVQIFLIDTTNERCDTRLIFQVRLTSSPTFSSVRHVLQRTFLVSVKLLLGRHLAFSLMSVSQVLRTVKQWGER
jgi:hypothetical protein